MIAGVEKAWGDCRRVAQREMPVCCVLARYEAAKKKGDYDEETQRREHAKNALERYMHYYQRWAENDRARLKVRAAMCMPSLLMFHSLCYSVDGPCVCKQEWAVRGNECVMWWHILPAGMAGSRSQVSSTDVAWSQDEQCIFWVAAASAGPGFKLPGRRMSRCARGGAQALSTMRDFQEKLLEKLSEITMTPTSQLRFLLDAWLQARAAPGPASHAGPPARRLRARASRQHPSCWASQHGVKLASAARRGQVVDCRRILKWTYAYGYYRFGEQAVNGAAAAVSRDVLRQRQEFFEFNQARACAGDVTAELGLECADAAGPGAGRAARRAGPACTGHQLRLACRARPHVQAALCRLRGRGCVLSRCADWPLRARKGAAAAAALKVSQHERSSGPVSTPAAPKQLHMAMTVKRRRVDRAAHAEGASLCRPGRGLWLARAVTAAGSERGRGRALPFCISLMKLSLYTLHTHTPTPYNPRP